jgi:hypothetical protein
MPSHIYVLLGMWPDTVKSNIAAAAAEKARGNPDDHMHALDYLVYGFLQMAQDVEAKKVVDEARAIMAELAAKKYDSGRPTAHFAMAAIEARWALERGQWAEAAAIDPRPNRFPHTESMVYLARALGAARTGNGARARADVDRLAALKDSMKDAYWAEQIEIQRRAAARVDRARGGQGRGGLRADALGRGAGSLHGEAQHHAGTDRDRARAARRHAAGGGPAGPGGRGVRGLAARGTQPLQGAARRRPGLPSARAIASGPKNLLRPAAGRRPATVRQASGPSCRRPKAFR